MHKIEDVLRQLNAASAKIQPELATHLLQIQQRMDRAHQTTEHRPFHANATQPVLAQVTLAASTSSFASERPASTFTPATLTQTIAADQPLIVQAAVDGEVAASLWIDPLNNPLRDAVTFPPDTTRRASTSQHSSAASSATSVSIDDAVTQPHEPSTPHFVLRQNQLAAPRPTLVKPGDDQPTESSLPVLDSPVVERSESQESTFVPLTTTTSETGVELGLPLFESLWFRQAAPHSYAAKLVDRILQKVPDCVPAVLHFCQDLQSRASSSLVCTQIAWEMSRRGLGEVLLVDADYGHRDISRQLGHVYLPGLSESINLGHPLDVLIRPTGVENLSWLPSGSGDISFRRIAGGRWAEISVQLRRRFQWVCVHAGAAQDRVTATWGRFCDYSFLITSMEDDLGPATKQVVDLLRTTECRVSGLITID